MESCDTRKVYCTSQHKVLHKLFMCKEQFLQTIEMIHEIEYDQITSRYSQLICSQIFFL